MRFEQWPATDMLQGNVCEMSLNLLRDLGSNLLQVRDVYYCIDCL